MKIAFFTDVYQPVISGLVENIDTSAAALRKMGHEVFIVAPKTPGYNVEDPNVFWIPSIKYNKEPELRLIVPLPQKDMRRLLTADFDIIHGHAGGPTCFLGLEIARRKKIPYIYTHHTRMQLYTHYVFHGRLISPEMAKMGLRILANFSTRVIVPTKSVKKELASWGVKRPIEVVAGGLDLAKFSPQKRGFLRTRFHLGESAVILMYVGRVGIEKNIDFLIRSFALVTKKIPQSYLFIVGDGPEKGALEKLAHKLGVEDKVIFTGFVPMDEVAKAYADGDVFVFSSKTETQGLVLYEAMSQGLPVIAVHDKAFEEGIINGETGFQTAGNRQDFSSVLVKVVNDPVLRQKLGSRGQKLVEEEYSSERQAEKLSKIYAEAVDEKSQIEDSNIILKKNMNKLLVFLKMNDRINKFKELVIKLPKW